MLRIDGAYLYGLGGSLKPIATFKDSDTPIMEVFFEIISAKESLRSFVYDSVFRDSLRTLVNPANELLNALNGIVPNLGSDVDFNSIIPAWQIASLKGSFVKLEAVLIAALQNSAMYYVSPKGGFDTSSLTDDGTAIFPNALETKAPEAVPDVMAGARCLAFELPTAAGFHFHRANEAVLRRYFDEVAGEENRPASRNMGDYINIMKTKKVGDPKVIEVLKSLKDLHRNPLMHPDDVIDSIDEAISLYSAIRAAIGYMLDRIVAADAPVIAPLPFDPPERQPT